VQWNLECQESVQYSWKIFRRLSRLDFVRIQEVEWNEGNTAPAEVILFWGKKETKTFSVG